MRTNKIGNILVNMKLGWQFSLLIIALVFGMGALTILLLMSTMSRALHHELEAKGVAYAQNLAANCEEPILLNHLVRLQHLIDNTKASETEIRYVYIMDARQQVLAHTFAAGFPKALRTLHDLNAVQPYYHADFQAESEKIHDIGTPISEGRLGFVHIGLSLSLIEQNLADTRRRITLLTLLISLLGVIIALRLGATITKPLHELVAVAKRIGQGDLEQEIRVTADNEVGLLTRTLSTMNKELKNLIHGRDTAIAALQRSEALYRSLVENIDLGVSLIDQEYTIVMINPAMEKIFRTEPENLIGKKCFQIFRKQTQDTACEHCPGSKVLVSGRPFETEYEGCHADGTPFHLRLRAFPFFIADHKIGGFIEIVEDITDRMKREEDLVRTRKLESVGILAGGIAHDFNNLMTAVYGNIELARMMLDAHEEPHRLLTAAAKATERTRHLTNQLLTFSAGGLPVKQVASIQNLLQESSDFILSGSAIKYVLDTASPLWPVEIDTGQMEQVIHNLLLNARDAMPSGGTVTIRTENLQLTATETLPLPPGQYVHISVTDSGNGIDPKIMPQIFDPYFSTKKMGTQKGMGLGLAICHSIISKHGGHIAAESMPGHGATFHIYLPVPAQAMAKPEEPEQQPDTVESPAHGRILLMEDEEVVIHITSEMLKHLGYDFSIARNGEEAISLYRQARESGKPFSAVILDLTIRGGMGGLETIKHLAEYDPEVKAIVASGYTADAVMADHGAYGFMASIEKPYGLGALQNALQEVVGKQEM